MRFSGQVQGHLATEWSTALRGDVMSRIQEKSNGYSARRENEVWFLNVHIAFCLAMSPSIPSSPTGIKPALPALQTWSLNHWITREVLSFVFFKKIFGLTVQFAGSQFSDQGLKLSPCIARQILNHWTTREVPDRLLVTCQFVFLPENPQASNALFLLGLRRNRAAHASF